MTDDDLDVVAMIERGASLEEIKGITEADLKRWLDEAEELIAL